MKIQEIAEDIKSHAADIARQGNRLVEKVDATAQRLDAKTDALIKHVTDSKRTLLWVCLFMALNAGLWLWVGLKL